MKLKNLSTASLNPVILISPLSSMTVMLKSLPSPRELLQFRMADLLLTLARIFHLTKRNHNIQYIKKAFTHKMYIWFICLMVYQTLIGYLMLNFDTISS